MKNVWKRTACLLLSGLLLFGSVPVQALATEEVVEEVFEETIKPLDEEGTDQTDSRQMISLVTDEVLEEDPSLQEITYYPVYVNEIQITSDNMWDVLNDGTVFYDGSGRLTLNGAVLTGIRADSAPLTINLVGENEIYAGDLTAIQTGRDLTITGEGSLAVTTENAIAVSVAGSGEEENKVGLIVDGAQLSVLVSENTDVTEWYPVGISSVNGVRIQKDAHVVTSHTAASQVYTVCAGYIKEEGQESFFPVAAEQEITATGGGLEFVSGEHVTYSATDTQHVLGCHEDCQLTKRTVLTGAHSEGQERDLVATCRTLAFCSVCNREYGKLKDHTGEEQWFPTEDGSQHVKKYSVCACIVGDPLPHETESEPVLSENKEALVRICRDCQAEVTLVKIIAPAGDDNGKIIYDGQQKVATTDLENAGTICYYQDFVPEARSGGSTEAPVNAGNYIAVLSIEGQDLKPQVSFSVEKKPLTADMITVHNASDLVYHEDPNPPLTKRKVTVGDLQEGKDFKVEFYRGSEKTTDYNSAGTITVKVTILDACENYTGCVDSITYEIGRADVAENAFTPDIPENGFDYDGKAKTIKAKKAGRYAQHNYGTATVEFYKNGNVVEQPIDAGTYTLKVHVAENQNYNSTVIEGKNTPWTVEIKPAKDYAVTVADEQTIGDGYGSFQWPEFTGIIRDGETEPEEVAGSIVYTYNGSQTEKSVIEQRLAELKDGETAQIGYTFTPAAGGNYLETNPKTGTIAVKKVKLTFTMGDGEAVTAENVKADGTVHFGQEKIIDVSGLKATVNGQTGNPGEGFFVRYAMEKAGTAADAEYPLEQPNAGSAKFCVYYTGMGFENVEVVKGNIYVNPKPYSELQIIAPQAVTNLTETSGAVKGEQNLITAGSVDGIAMEYALEENGQYSTTIPKAAENGVYRVHYRSPDNGNYTQDVKGSVDVVIRPYLTAIYGETLADVEGRIESDGIWAFESPTEKTKVGNVTENGNTFKMSYTPEGANAPTVTNCDVLIHVEPAHVALDVELIKARYHKHTGAEIRPSVSVKVKQNSNARDAVEGDEFPETEYMLTYSGITNPEETTATVKPGKAKVTVTSRGNYIFDNAEELTEEYIIFRPGFVALADTETAVPPELKGTYKTGADMKAALGELYDENFPESKRSYVKYLMMNGGSGARYDEFYWPDGGYGTLSWDYAGGVTGNDAFEIYGMYLVTSERLGTEAGGIFRMTESDDSTPGINEFYVAEDGIKFRLKNYAVLCFAAEVDPNATYSISTTAKNGTVKFTVGSDTTKLTEAGAVKVDEMITVTATPKSGYALTSVKYTYKEGGREVPVAVEQNSSGKYVFRMPDKDIVLTATFARKTSNSKNPYSGDASRIVLWLTILAVSGAGVAALMAFWFKKRKK